MKKQKKGAEAIVTFVLLIGFAIAITALVFVFERDKGKEIITSKVNYEESRIECNDVAINNAACVTQPCDENNENCEGCYITVINTGKLPISGLTFRDQKGQKAEYGAHLKGSEFFPMAPGLEVRPCPGRRNNDLSHTGIEIIPIVNISNKLYACQDKIISVPDGSNGDLCYCPNSDSWECQPKMPE